MGERIYPWYFGYTRLHTSSVYVLQTKIVPQIHVLLYLMRELTVNGFQQLFIFYHNYIIIDNSMILSN